MCNGCCYFFFSVFFFFTDNDLNRFISKIVTSIRKKRKRIGKRKRTAKYYARDWIPFLSLRRKTNVCRFYSMEKMNFVVSFYASGFSKFSFSILAWRLKKICKKKSNRFCLNCCICFAFVEDKLFGSFSELNVNQCCVRKIARHRRYSCDSVLSIQ